MTIPRKRKQEERGQSLVEFSLALLAFLLFVFGIVESGRLLESWVTIQHASREATRYGVTGRTDCDSASDDRLLCIEETAMDAAATLQNPATVQVSIRSWDFPDYLDPATENSAGDACDLLEVQVQYDHQVVVPLIGAITGDEISLSARQRMVNEPFDACS